MSRSEEAVKKFVATLSQCDVGLRRKTVALVEHCPAWFDAFKWVSAQIMAVIPSNVGANVLHVGSTSVASLRAKPILDILVVFPSADEQLAAIPVLEGLGFIHKGDGIARVAGTESDPSRHFYSYYDLAMEVDFVHLHTYVVGHPDIDRLILFRDRLRRDAVARDRYEQLKSDIHSSGKVRREYTRSKKTLIDELLASS